MPAITPGQGQHRTIPVITKLHISRFKSIRELSLNCKRINIFIGEPNTGKSNILEALGMFSFVYYSRFGYSAKQFIRFERTGNLFYDESLDYPLEITCDSIALKMEFKNGRFEGLCNESEGSLATLRGDHRDFRVDAYVGFGRTALFKPYRFSVRETFPRIESDSLMPPSGENLPLLLLANRELRSIVNQPFLSMGFRLGIRPQEGKLEIIKQLDDVIVSYPYSLASETLQRLTFYLAAILSNKESVLVFEEPESHAFPYYTKYLAELIALDQNNNQYFISTHNPYFLLPILEKSPKNEVSVHIIYFENYETKAKEIAEKDLEELAEIDIFSNLERYLEGDDLR